MAFKTFRYNFACRPSINFVKTTESSRHSDSESIRFHCEEPAISLRSYHVSLVQWTTRLLPVMRDMGSIPGVVLMWNRDFPVSVVSLHWWPRRDWSLWPRLRRALSRTVTRPSCRYCDNPTWSHTAFLSQFHTRCRSSFWFHNQHSRLLRGSPVESLQSHCIYIMSHWSSGLPVCFLSWGTRVQSPGGYLCETGILLLALSCYITPNIVSAGSLCVCATHHLLPPARVWNQNLAF